MRFSYHRGLVFLLIIFIFCLGTGLGRSYADQVFLTNGDRISGSLITFSPTGVQISSPHSGTIHIERQYVQRLATDDRVVVELVIWGTDHRQDHAGGRGNGGRSIRCSRQPCPGP